MRRGFNPAMFIDTNVLVKSRIPNAPDHDVARISLDRAFRDPEPLRISRQVIRECLAVVTRPQTWPVGITREDALDDVSRLIGSFEMLEGWPRGDRVANVVVPRSSGWWTADSRRQHRGDHARPRRTPTADVQRIRLSTFRGPNRVGGQLGSALR